jgi:hypothetical protein
MMRPHPHKATSTSWDPPRRIFDVAGRPALLAGILALALLTGTASAITSSGVEVTNPDGSTSWPNLFADVDINDFVGASTLYNLGYYGTRATIANVEAGFTWDQHDVTKNRDTPITQIKDPTAVGGYDWHATMVGHVLVGESPDMWLTISEGSWWYMVYGKIPYGWHLQASLSDGSTISLDSTLWYGIAPKASLTSTAIATGWVRSSAIEYGGEFNISMQTAYTGYQMSMSRTATGGAKADVINSSWGGDDPAGIDPVTKLIDALAYANRTTVCLAAGNDGAGQVGGPASGYNSISVGALAYDSASHPYHAVADFSSRGAGDFYNPKTGATIPGVRATVDLVAPGDNLTLACYGGLTGGHNPDIGTDPTQGDGGYYFIGVSGTSFASPIVAGGAALLVDVGKDKFAAISAAIDGRVIKAVLMNSADKVDGWDNGQHTIPNPLVPGRYIIVTEQSLDYASGTGRMDLTRAYNQYTLGSPNAAPGNGLRKTGWSYDVIAPNGTKDYSVGEFVAAGTTLAATLDWFVDRAIGTDTIDGTPAADEVQFANLDLEIWKLTGLNGTPDALVAESDSIYNNVEHLFFDAPDDGYYMLRVTWAGENYGLVDPTAEPYALAWALPEPGTLLLLAGGAVLTLLRRRRKAA